MHFYIKYLLILTDHRLSYRIVIHYRNSLKQKSEYIVKCSANIPIVFACFAQFLSTTSK